MHTVFFWLRLCLTYTILSPPFTETCFHWFKWFIYMFTNLNFIESLPCTRDAVRSSGVRWRVSRYILCLLDSEKQTISNVTSGSNTTALIRATEETNVVVRGWMRKAFGQHLVIINCFPCLQPGTWQGRPREEKQREAKLERIDGEQSCQGFINITHGGHGRKTKEKPNL